MPIGIPAYTLNIGKKTDFIGVPYDPGVDTALAYLRTGYYHIHGDAFTYPKYAAPVTLIAHTGAWDQTGNIIEIIPANAIIKAFDLHWLTVTAISANLEGIVVIYAGAVGHEIEIGSADISRTSNFVQEGPSRIMVPQQPANTRISARFVTSTVNADTCNVKLRGHVYG